MNHERLKEVILDQRETVQKYDIADRFYSFEPHANYVLTGLRRAGKSTLLYKMARDLAEKGVDWNQIIYINFEDDRLAEFSLADFDDIVQVQKEFSQGKGYFFFDEIQNIEGWEKFARRLADSKEYVQITGSNAKMLSREIESTLGARYLSKFIKPYSFKEYLNAKKIDYSKNALLATASKSLIRSEFENYLNDGGFPESLIFQTKREYVSAVYQKVLLGDIVAKNGLRNDHAIRIMLKKIAESVCSEISYTKICNLLKTIGIKISKDTIIDYVKYAKAAYLIFSLQNYFSAFADKESLPKYYFGDNGLLHLFMSHNDTSLLENLAAVTLSFRYPGDLYYLKSAENSIDVDFYISSIKTAVQVAWSIEGEYRGREVQSLVKLSSKFSEAEHFLILTNEGEEVIREGGIEILVKPMYKWLLEEEMC